MPVEEIPVIRDLDEFAQSLPPQHRAKVYEIAQSFLNIGAANGICIYTKIANDQAEFLAYLSRREREAKG